MSDTAVTSLSCAACAPLSVSGFRGSPQSLTQTFPGPINFSSLPPVRLPSASGGRAASCGQGPRAPAAHACSPCPTGRRPKAVGACADGAVRPASPGRRRVPATRFRTQAPSSHRIAVRIRSPVLVSRRFPSGSNRPHTGGSCGVGAVSPVATAGCGLCRIGLPACP